MTQSIRRLGLVGGILAVLFIFGLNFAALEKQWDVPYIGMKKAHASGYCAMGYCMVVTPSGAGENQWGCWTFPVSDPYDCGTGCTSC